MIAIYPGSFDPITYGHIDIIERSAKMVDKLIILIMHNEGKVSGLFDIDERIDMIKQAVSHIPNVSVEAGTGLTVEYARKVGASLMIRGIRAVSDYEYEMQLATANMMLAPEIETIFLLTKPEYSFLSSSTAKEVAKNNGDLTHFTNEYVAGKLKEKYSK